MAASLTKPQSNLWSYVKRVAAGLLGVLVTAASGLAIYVLLAFWWWEWRSWPDEVVTYTGAGALAYATVASIYWLWRMIRGHRLSGWDLLMLPLPLAAVSLFLAFQWYA